MGKHDKVREKVESGHSDANIRFDDACNLLHRLGFASRSRRTSHVVFALGEHRLNLQNHNGKIPPYQVRQIRETLQKLR